MKQLKQSFRFSKGSEVSQVAIDTDGKTYIRKLPELIDHRVIDVSLLAELLTRFTQNEIELTREGIKINKIEIIIGVGVVTFKKMKFRFADLYDLLRNLRQEQILICAVHDFRVIQHNYYMKSNELENV